VVLCWFIAFKMGLGINTQLYIVVTLGILVTFVFYPFVQSHIRKQSTFYRILRRIALLTHAERKGFWAIAQKWADRSTNKEINTL
jgi:hypothetical protein